MEVLKTRTKNALFLHTSRLALGNLSKDLEVRPISRVVANKERGKSFPVRKSRTVYCEPHFTNYSAFHERFWEKLTHRPC